jgi:hypothetical protein
MSERRDLSTYHPGATQLSYEGTLEILDEIENGPKDTPERRATVERARAMRPLLERLRQRRRDR